MSKIFQKEKTGKFLSHDFRHDTLSITFALHSNPLLGIYDRVSPANR